MKNHLYLMSEIMIVIDSIVKQWFSDKQADSFISILIVILCLLKFSFIGTAFSFFVSWII